MSKITTLLKGNVRIYINDALDVAQEAINKQKTMPLGSLVLATAVTTFSTLNAMYPFQKITALLSGNGANGTVLVEISSDGDIRAYIANPQTPTDADNKNINDIPLTVGIGAKGTLKIVREVKDLSFGGEVSLANGDIVTDLAFYFDQSDQIFSAVVTDVSLANKSELKSAKNVIFQLLPDHTEEDKVWVERFIKTNLLSEMSVKQYIEKLDAQHMNQQEIKWNCSCSAKKMKQLLQVIPEAEQKDIIAKVGKLEINCNYCNKKYTL